MNEFFYLDILLSVNFCGQILTNANRFRVFTENAKTNRTDTNVSVSQDSPEPTVKPVSVQL